jgi:peptidoglycan/LPS O-acetylase OafA/YrhL
LAGSDRKLTAAAVDRSRGEVQALRAAAVAVVVVYHFWPDRLPGGFVGVDVFFVISGFLITAHLMREVTRTGSVSLAQFWARRARRLLPASLLVLLVSAVGVLVLVPQVYWQQFLKEITASALYVQNWVLASDSIDYLAAENIASPAQHFWSLSVEEQFYLVWPVLILAALLISHRLTPTRRRWIILGMLGLIFAASLTFSILFTATNPGPAYFITPTRAWEFAAGGLLAIIGATATAHPHLRTGIAWAGWTGITATTLTFTSQTPFPSYAALLPVLATLAIIWAGNPATAWSPNRILTQRPITFIGDISYSIYLWHWPVLILAQFRFGDGMGWKARLALIATTIALAWATTRLVENPIRQRPWLTTRKPRWTLAAATLAMAIAITPALAGWNHITQQAQAENLRAEELLTGTTPCFGAAAIRNPSCTNKPVTLIPAPATAVSDLSDVYTQSCIAPATSPDVRECVFGRAGADYRVALIGDSHAVSWFPELEAIATAAGWELSTYLKSACAQSDAVNYKEPGELFDSCRDWNDDLSAKLAAEEPFDLVVVSHSITGTHYASVEEALAGFQASWARYTKRGSDVVVMRDTPRVPADTNECLIVNVEKPAACGVEEKDAFPREDLMVAAATGQRNVTVVDMSDYFCFDGVCPAAIGGVVVYRDGHHITKTYARSLAPYLSERLADAVGTERLPTTGTPCFGAASRDRVEDCDEVEFTMLTPSPSTALEDKSALYRDSCITASAGSDIRRCVYGVDDSDYRVAIVGDSHVASWFPAYQKLAEEQGWQLVTYVKSACPRSDAINELELVERFQSCRTWNEKMVKELAADDAFDLAIVSYSSQDARYRSDSDAIEGFRSAWHDFTDRGARVIVMRDNPRVSEDTNACLAKASDPLQCAPSEENALIPDLMARAARGEENVAVIDMTDFLCWNGSCPVVIGGVVVYRDSHHLTATYATTLAPYIGSRLGKILD